MQQLAFHAVGGVVTSAQPLMIVVPEQPEVTAEISKDTGLVNASQRAEVTLAFSRCTRDGTVDSRDKLVTDAAATAEKRASEYPAVLTLTQD